MKNKDVKRDEGFIYVLSKNKVIVLFVYYFLLFAIGGFISIKIAVTLTATVTMSDIVMDAFGVSISISGMMCSIQYIKRLYKACITERIDITEGDTMKKIGNMAYFIFRPIFAFGFSIIMVFALLSGMFVIIGNLDYILNEKFVYLCAIFASFIGYSIGKLIDKFGDISIEKINNLK